MTPGYQIFIDGNAPGSGFNDRLTDLVLTLHEAMRSDELKLIFDDRDRAIALPPKGVVIALLIDDGRGDGLQPMGLYEVRGRKRGFTKERGRFLEVHARAADMQSEMKQPRTGADESQTLEQIVTKRAARYGMTAKVSPQLGQIMYDFEPQSEESDIHLLSRLARDHDAIFQVAGGKFLFLSRDEITAVVEFDETDFIECTVDDDDRAQHGKSTAHSHDRGKAERVPQTYDADDGSEGPEAMLRHTFSNPTLAQAAAKGRQQRLQRLEKRLHGVLTGDTSVMAGMTGIIAWGVELMDGDYALKTVTHHLVKGGGMTTAVDSHKGKKGKASK